jgi:hypothetical protein
MDAALRDRFIDLWRKYFRSAELPIACFYTSREEAAPAASVPAGHRCVVALLAQARNGRALRLSAESAGCGGARRYLGFGQELEPDFAYFLSCGVPGRLEGERYKQSPELVQSFVAHSQPFTAPAPFLVVKRWDGLDAEDAPEIVIFLAPPDVLAGLFTLANYDETDDAVVAPFGAGCASIIQRPYLEARSRRPRVVLGMFDVSARPYVPPDVLSMAIPMQKFERMVANMDQSFLATRSWAKLGARMSGA